MKENISLHDCCYENEKKISTVTKESLLQTGADIISSYGMDKRYMIEKYSNCHIKNAMYYIHSHIDESLTLADVCEHICITPSYLCQLFKRDVGMSFCDYVMSHRLKVAKGLLNCTDNPIEEIALKCGFKNDAYFSTCYKKVYGIFNLSIAPKFIKLHTVSLIYAFTFNIKVWFYFQYHHSCNIIRNVFLSV